MSEIHSDEVFRSTGDLITQELAVIEERIVKHEADLAQLKALRTRGRKLLAFLDPQAEQPRRKRNSNAWSVSDAKLGEILGSIQSMNGGAPFTSQNVSDESGVHITTVHKALKVLHERGAIRIDHLGGPRGTTKFYALVGGNDG